MGTETLKPEDNYSCEPVEYLRLLFRQNPSNLPQISKIHLMMFLIFLIMSPCTAINLSLNKAFS